MNSIQNKKIEAEQKINAALRALGLTFAEGFRIVCYNPEVETARWIYFNINGEEAIELGDKIVNLPIDQIEMVLRHEFLHRSVYHGFGEQYADHQICNIVLDICINRLLFESFPREMKDLSLSVYPAESKNTVIALADCSVNSAILKQPYKQLWKYIWEPIADDTYNYLNPASLYFKLVELNVPDAGQTNPFFNFPENGKNLPKEIPSRIVRAGSKIAQSTTRKFPQNSKAGEWYEKYSVIPIKIGINDVEEFLQRIHVKTVISKFSAKIKEPLQHTTHLQPYPLFPSRLGYIYQILGLTDIWRMFWNQDVSSVGVRLAIGMYFDVSGSMIENFPVISGFVEALKEYPVRLHSFDTKVKDISLEDYKNGKIQGGGGTNFDCVVNDFVNDQELVAAVIFTDGLGDLSELVGNSLKINRKKLYVVYINTMNVEPKNNILKKYAADSISVEIKDSKLINYKIG